MGMKINDCIIGERCKRVKVTESVEKSDCQQLREILNDASEKDLSLKAMLSGFLLSFQKLDPIKNRFIDIENDESLENGSDVHVMLTQDPAITGKILTEISILQIDRVNLSDNL